MRKIELTLLLILTLTQLTSASAFGESAKPLVNCGGSGLQTELNARHWQLFIDDFAIARATGLDRVIHHPRPVGVVIPADKPWETFGTAPIYVGRRAEGMFFAFYQAYWWDTTPQARIDRDRAHDFKSAIAYATSKDGIHWDKPELGLVEAPAGIDWKKFPPFPSPQGASKANNLGVPFSVTDLAQFGKKHNRFVSLRAQSHSETLITKPFDITGETLQLNVDASRGRARVGIAAYQPVPSLGGSTLTTAPHMLEQNLLPGFRLDDCEPVLANAVNHTVRFKGGPSLKNLQGRRVALFIELLDADLFGFRIQ